MASRFPVGMYAASRGHASLQQRANPLYPRPRLRGARPRHSDAIGSMAQCNLPADPRRLEGNPGPRTVDPVAASPYNASPAGPSAHLPPPRNRP
jgi:hypothetical protein